MRGELVLLIIVFMTVATLVVAHWMEKDEDRFRCYHKKEYTGQVSKGRCSGIGDKLCRGCQYRKNMEDDK